MNTEKNPPARRPAKVWLATLSLLLLVLTCATQARAQEGTDDTAQEPKMSDLLKMAGKVIAESDAPRAAGKFKVRNYRVEELTLPRPVEVTVGGKRAEVSRAFRVTVTGGPFPVRAMPAVVWIDDVAVGFGVESEELDAITAVTFDASLLREGATVYLSYGDKENKADRSPLPEKLKLGANKGGNQ
jgi:hypothetical protein